MRRLHCVPGLCSSWVRCAGCLWEKTTSLQRRVWWPRRIGTKTSVPVRKRHCNVIVPPDSKRGLDLYLCVLHIVFLWNVHQIQIPPTTSTLLGYLLVMLLIISMPPWWQWVDTHTLHTHTHTPHTHHTHTHTHMRAHSNMRALAISCSMQCSCAFVELLQATWFCCCPVSIGVYQEWSLGAGLAAKNQKHCAALLAKGRENGRQDVTLLASLCYLSDLHSCKLSHALCIKFHLYISLSTPFVANLDLTFLLCISVSCDTQHVTQLYDEYHYSKKSLKEKFFANFVDELRYANFSTT